MHLGQTEETYDVGQKVKTCRLISGTVARVNVSVGTNYNSGVSRLFMILSFSSRVTTTSRMLLSDL